MAYGMKIFNDTTNVRIFICLLHNHVFTTPYKIRKSQLHTRLRSLYATQRLLRRLLESALTQSSSNGGGTPATLSDARRALAGSPAAGRQARTPWPPKQAGLVWCLCRIWAAARNLTRWRRCDWWRRLPRRAQCAPPGDTRRKGGASGLFRIVESCNFSQILKNDEKG